MGIVFVSRYATFIGAVALLAGCGTSQMPSGMTGATRQVSRAAAPASSSYRVLSRFVHLAGGTNPLAPLLDVHGTLYGTAAAGGISNYGTVFRVSTSGKKTTLYRFRGGSADGEYPNSRLLDVNGSLYGTTSNGGLTDRSCNIARGEDSGCGTVFVVTTSGKEKILYKFQGGSNGANPTSGLTEVNGLLYGTTRNTIYSITPNGKEASVHNFESYIDPEGDLIEMNGKLFGTTVGGGAESYGSVYSITTSGVEKVLHSFNGGYFDGSFPHGGLLDVNGTLYGTTLLGGNRDARCQEGCGTVFSVTPSGTEKVLYEFSGNPDAQNPMAGLVYTNGYLYGTSTLGGGNRCRAWYGSGCGTIFSVKMSGEEQIVHSFAGGSDGAIPKATLLEVDGTLFGTTQNSHTKFGNGRGPGTVFALTP